MSGRPVDVRALGAGPLGAGPLGAPALLRYELIRWRTGWVNALKARDRATRLRVLRRLTGGTLIVCALVWLATRTLGGPSTAALPASEIDASAALALLFSLALLTGGVRHGAAVPDPIERWLSATGASAEAISSRRLARTLSRLLPLSWAPLIPLDNSLLQGEVLRVATLSAGGFAFAVAGVALGTLVRRHRLAVYVGTTLALGFAAIVAGMVGFLVPDSPLLALGRAVAAPWSWLATPTGAIASPGLAAVAIAIAFVVVRSDLRSPGWTTGKRVRVHAKRDAGAPMHGHFRTLATLELRRLSRIDVNDVVAVVVLAAGTAALAFVASMGPDRGQILLTGRGPGIAGFFALLLPTIVAGELVWGRKPLAFWSYLRATGGDLRTATRTHVLAAATVTLGWAVFVSGCVATASGKFTEALAFAIVLTLLSLAAAAGGALGAAAALRTGDSNTRLATLIRYAGAAIPLAATATLSARGSYLGAAALALILSYAAPTAAARLIASTELTITKPS